MNTEGIKFDFTDQVVLITGAGQGIGAAVARAFAEAAANLVLADINEGNLLKLKDELEALPGDIKVLPVRTDVASLDDINNMVDKAISAFGKIDVLFNNAGISRYFAPEDLSPEDWRKVMSVNLDGVFFVAQAVGRTMIKRRKGKIINTASTSSFIVNRQRSNGVYCISKAAVVMLTRVLALSWAKYNIEVNAIAPGYTRTPLIMNAMNDPERRKAMEARSPKNRVAEPEEIAGAVLFLASPASSYISGDTLKIDAGYTIGW